jgi:hypothetical protein
MYPAAYAIAGNYDILYRSSADLRASFGSVVKTIDSFQPATAGIDNTL